VKKIHKNDKKSDFESAYFGHIYIYLDIFNIIFVYL